MMEHKYWACFPSRSSLFTHVLSFALRPNLPVKEGRTFLKAKRKRHRQTKIVSFSLPPGSKTCANWKSARSHESRNWIFLLLIHLLCRTSPKDGFGSACIGFAPDQTWTCQTRLFCSHDHVHVAGIEWSCIVGDQWVWKPDPIGRGLRGFHYYHGGFWDSHARPTHPNAIRMRLTQRRCGIIRHGEGRRNGDDHDVHFPLIMVFSPTTTSSSSSTTTYCISTSPQESECSPCRCSTSTALPLQSMAFIITHFVF